MTPAPPTLLAGQGAQPGDIINAIAVQRNQLMDALAMAEANFAAFRRAHQGGGCGLDEVVPGERKVPDDAPA